MEHAQPTKQTGQQSSTIRYVLLIAFGLICIFVGQSTKDMVQFINFPPTIFYTLVIASPIVVALGYFMVLLGGFLFLRQWTGGLVLPVSRSGSAGRDVELQDAIQRRAKEPGKVGPTWEIAQIKLDQYFDRNLRQINQIFWLSVAVMGVGFLFILIAISQAVTYSLQPSSASTSIQSTGESPQVNEGAVQTNSQVAMISGLAGIITEFIGATFLYLYRSTIKQASDYTKTLERINTVGMAVWILDTLSVDSKELQDQTKAEVAKELFKQLNTLSITKPGE